MKQKLLILLLGCSPLLLGRLQDFCMTNLMWNVPLLLITALMLLLWAFLSNSALYLLDGKKIALFLLNAPAVVTLALILVQEWIFGAYWMNSIGIYSQLFYLPLISLGFRLTFWANSIPPAYITAFLTMILVSVLVYKKKKT